MAKDVQTVRHVRSRVFSYDLWMESQGIPIHKGYCIEDLRTLDLGWWEERQCHAAFIQLMGQEGVASAWVAEVPPGKNLPPMQFALDQLVYVASGRGITTLWAQEGKAKKSFEWQEHSLFLIPRNSFRQFSNMQGDKPARLLHYSYLPLAMSAIPEPPFFFDNPYQSADLLSDPSKDFYSEAKLVQAKETNDFIGLYAFWYGNFFPDMRAWDKLDANMRRGAGGKSVFIQFPDSELYAHMSVFPAQTYKKAHRHGPGRVIVIPAGEGYSIMWEEGKDKVVVPWHECSVFVPPNKWFHQHFNVGATTARYLALHPPMQFDGHAEKVEDRAKDQIEYPNEEPWIRQKFEGELKKKGLKSLVPEEAYKDKNYVWSKDLVK